MADAAPAPTAAPAPSAPPPATNPAPVSGSGEGLPGVPSAPAPSSAPLDAASAQADTGKAAALTALAQGGTAGLAALNQSKATIASTQQQALDRTLGQAMGAPAGAAGELSSIVKGPGDAASSALGGYGQFFTANNDLLKGAAGTYFDEAKAAVPVIKAAADKEITLAKLRWQERAAADQATAHAKAAAQNHWQILADATGAGRMAKEQAGQQLAGLAQQRGTLQDQLTKLDQAEGAAAQQATQGQVAGLSPKDRQLEMNPTTGGAAEAGGQAAESQYGAQRQALEQQIASIDQQTQQLQGIQSAPDYELQRQAAISAGIPSVEAYGLFGAPAAQTPSQQLTQGRAQLNLAALPAMDPGTAAKLAGVRPELVNWQWTLKAPTSTNPNATKSVNVYDASQKSLQDYLRQGMTVPEAISRLSQTQQQIFGRPMNDVNSLLAAQYTPQQDTGQQQGGGLDPTQLYDLALASNGG